VGGVGADASPLPWRGRSSVQVQAVGDEAVESGAGSGGGPRGRVRDRVAGDAAGVRSRSGAVGPGAQNSPGRGCGTSFIAAHEVQHEYEGSLLVWVMTAALALGIIGVRTGTGNSYRRRAGESRLRQASGRLGGLADFEATTPQVGVLLRLEASDLIPACYRVPQLSAPWHGRDWVEDHLVGITPARRQCPERGTRNTSTTSAIGTPRPGI
jgi:hypothetical protein